MARPFPLSAIKSGITRLRTKGGANPDSLYDLINGRVTAANSVEPRDGTAWDATLPEGTKGLAAFLGKLHVFASAPVGAVPALFEVHVLRHPTSTSVTLARIHFAKPIMRGLYVAAEFSNGDVFHYYLQNPPIWAPEEGYELGELVSPSVDNGFSYRASRLNPPAPLWAPLTARVVGAKVEPTKYNGFVYTATATQGANPASGEIEPIWPTEDGAIIIEDADVPAVAPPTTLPNTTPTTTLPTSTQDRYSGGACLAIDQWLAPGQMVGDVREGDFADAHTPERGHHRAQCRVVGAPVLRQCVRITTASGCSVVCSIDTPVNFAEATEDMGPKQWTYAPYVVNRNVLDEDGPNRVVNVTPVGARWVVPLDFGGVSFAGGEDGNARVYTHNMAKQLEDEV